MRLRLWFLPQLVACTAAAQQPSVGPAHAPPNVSAAVREYMRAHGIPGLSLAVGYGGRVVLAQGFGSADLEHGILVTPATLFLIQSTQKLLTATAVLRLAEAGKLSLDDTVQTHCPAFGVRRWAVTLRQLLSHQGGIRSSDLRDLFNREHYASTDAALRRFVAESLQAPPGSKVAYSNAGYTLLACAIEGATAEPYDSALRHLVLQPAGLRATRPDNVFEVIRGRSRYYILRTDTNTEQWRGLWTDAHLTSTRLDEPANADPVDPSWAIGAGNYLGTPSDLIRFALALLSGRLLQSRYRDSAFAPAPLTATGEPTGRALGGWLLDTKDSLPQVLGSTWNGSFGLAVDPRTGLAVAVASNIELDQPTELFDRIIKSWPAKGSPK
ncbi:MAG: serine hydrolase domain-containing protein [Gemmatimonadales bacterium]